VRQKYREKWLKIRCGVCFIIRYSFTANKEAAFVSPFTKDPVLLHHAAGRIWRIAWRIAMMMFMNKFQSNIFSLTSLEVIVHRATG
jgi:hypothetical protein